MFKELKERQSKGEWVAICCRHWLLANLWIYRRWVDAVMVKCFWMYTFLWLKTASSPTKVTQTNATNKQRKQKTKKTKRIRNTFAEPKNNQSLDQCFFFLFLNEFFQKIKIKTLFFWMIVNWMHWIRKISSISISFPWDFISKFSSTNTKSS